MLNRKILNVSVKIDQLRDRLKILLEGILNFSELVQVRHTPTGLSSIDRRSHLVNFQHFVSVMIDDLDGDFACLRAVKGNALG